MSERFDFGEAINRLRAGKLVERAGWNGKGMWLRLVPEQPHTEQCARRRAYIEMWDATMYFVPWLASQTDVLAEDWQEVDRP